MSTAGINVELGADISGFLNGLAKSGKSLTDFKNQLERFKTQLEKASDPAAILRLNKAIEATGNRIKILNTVGIKAGEGLNKVNNAANTAGQSLTNLGRIAQDAPFGFIGIQNNINPLIESFQRLKAESGSTGSALKALGSSLLGGAGIGLAVSVITGLITTFAMSTRGAVEAVEDLGKKFNSSLKETEASGTAAGVVLQNFVNIARDQTQSLTTRNEALKEANKILGEHGEKLTLVNIETAAVTKQIQLYTQATIQQALANKFTDRAADLIIKQRDATKSYGVELNKLNELKKRTQSFENAQGVKVLTDAGKATVQQQRTLTASAKEYKEVTKELTDVTNNLLGAQLEASKLFGQLGTKTKDTSTTKPKALKDIETVRDIIQDLDTDLGNIDVFGRLFQKNSIQIATEKIAAIKAVIEKLVTDFKIPYNDTIIAKLMGDVNSDLFAGGRFFENIKDLDLRQQLAEKLDQATQAGPIEITVPILPVITLPPVTYDDPAIKAFEAQVTAAMQNVATNVATSFGEALGGALSGQKGGDVFAGFFAGIFKSLGAALKQLGVFAVTSSKIIMSIKAKLGTAGGIVGGIALIALGTLISAAASKIKVPAFANGVRNFSGGLALVGERGPELVTLPRGSDVIPNHALGSGSIGGGSNVLVSVEGRISGEYIYFSQQRFAERRGRMT